MAPGPPSPHPRTSVTRTLSRVVPLWPRHIPHPPPRPLRSRSRDALRRAAPPRAGREERAPTGLRRPGRAGRRGTPAPEPRWSPATTMASAVSQAGAARRRPDRHCASILGHSGSRSARPAAAQPAHGVMPGTTSGPTTPVASMTPAYRWGVPEASSGSAATGSGAYAARPSRGVITASASPGSPQDAGSRAARRGSGPGAVCRTRRRAARSRRSPIRSAGSPPGATSQGSTQPPSTTSTCPTPEAESAAATAAPTRPAPRTCTRIARRAASSRAAAPGSGCSTDSDAASGLSRSRAAAGSPPSLGSSSSPAAISRSISASARPSGRPMARASCRSSGRPRVPSSSSRKLPVAVSTGPITTACARATPNCTVSRLRQPRRSAGLSMGCIAAPPSMVFVGPPSSNRPQDASGARPPQKVVHRPPH